VPASSGVVPAIIASVSGGPRTTVAAVPAT
jgi:hypothetical protein